MAEGRTDVLKKDEYFMSIAFLSAMRSEDPNTQVGACIVSEDDKVVATGYNCMPKGCEGKLPWERNPATSPKDESWLETKYPYVSHAERNAVLNKNQADVKGCKMYVALFPCNVCAQIIIQSGIKEVVYYSNKKDQYNETKASKKMLEFAGILCTKYNNTTLKKEVTIKFDKIEESPQQTDKERDERKVRIPKDDGGDNKHINSDARD